MYWKVANGAGTDELLLKRTGPIFPNSWSRDGRFLLYTDTRSGIGNDLWILEIPGESSGKGKVVPFLKAPFDQWQGRFSPDGKWVAYTSSESGRREIYVRPFLVAPGQWQVSVGGGWFAEWRGDGKELFYLSADRKLMVVKVSAGTGANREFEASNPEELFSVPQTIAATVAPVSPYAVSADGQRFWVLARRGKAEDETPLTLIQNWPALVKEK